jgi:hypothetical protein
MEIFHQLKNMYRYDLQILDIYFIDKNINEKKKEKNIYFSVVKLS